MSRSLNSEYSPMVSLAELQTNARSGQIYRCQSNLDVFDAPDGSSLATQAAAGRYLEILDVAGAAFSAPVRVRLWEDGYSGWVRDGEALVPQERPVRPPALDRAEIENRLPGAIAFARAAMQVPNRYRWGGTIAPDYDCSGIVQAAFASQGIWLPRDTYQQEAFVQPVAREDLQPGDPIFFGSLERANHVGLYLGDGEYLHSSSPKRRNGIGIDRIDGDKHWVGRFYALQWRGCGRVVESYVP